MHHVTTHTVQTISRHLFFWILPLFQISLMVSLIAHIRDTLCRHEGRLLWTGVILFWNSILLLVLLSQWNYRADLLVAWDFFMS